MPMILLVDYDPMQASLMMSHLKQRFADVRRATDAAEALCLIEQPDFADKLSLVITGHHTPGIGGPAFVAELRSRMPQIPVLVLGAANASPSDYEKENVTLLPRPFATEEMLSLAGHMLAQARNAAA